MTQAREVPLEKTEDFREFLELLKQDSEGCNTFNLAIEALNRARKTLWT